METIKYIWNSKSYQHTGIIRKCFPLILLVFAETTIVIEMEKNRTVNHIVSVDITMDAD